MAFCPSCGAENAVGVKFCAACGKPMPEAMSPTQPPAQAPTPVYPPPQYPQPAYPAQPGYPQAAYAPPGYPTYPQYPQPYAYPAFQAPPQPTSLPLAGGALLITAGALGLVGVALSFLTFGGFLGFGDPIFGFLGTILIVCGVIEATFSVFALLGGIMAVQRKMWGLALVGSILGLFAIGPLFLSSILSLIALILIAVSHREFT